MANEIERKFLINEKSKNFEALMEIMTGTTISQGYLNTDPAKTVRVRQKGEQGFLTVKGKQVGITKPEYEYEIPLEDVIHMMLMCDVKLEKIRFETNAGNGLIWEIDIFKAANTGLIIAEIELSNENEKFEIPEWLGKDVSEDLRFANSNLAKHPYENWTQVEKAEIKEWKLLNSDKEKWELMKATIGSCNCLTKTPDSDYHKDDCNYKVISNKLKKLL